MPKLPLALLCAGTLALAGCQMTDQQRMLAGGAAGAAAGLLTASALGANSNWRILAALGGAAAGTLVARNMQTNECAYAVGDGTFRTGPCPS
ncbi:MAG: glycine zipper 2TM domain-containing protein [Alkalilacustris sp.]